MEDEKPKHEILRCCGCCAQPIPSDSIVAITTKRNRVYCNFACRWGDCKYRRLWIHAKIVADRYPAREIDPTEAQKFLKNFLEMRKQQFTQAA